VNEGRWDALVECLLVEHYDPAYLRSIGRNFTRSPAATPLALESEDLATFRAAARALAG
jgi:tRNA 2-selenouridine synthase